VPSSHPVAGSTAIDVKQVSDLPLLQDVAARMVALAYHKHRTMPELGQTADLVTTMLTSATLE
jgi:hypothetical protein